MLFIEFQFWFYNKFGLYPTLHQNIKKKIHDKKVNEWNLKYNTTSNGKYPYRKMSGIDIVNFENDICNYYDHMIRAAQLYKRWEECKKQNYELKRINESESEYKKRLYDYSLVENMSLKEINELTCDPIDKWNIKYPGLIKKYFEKNPDGEKDYTK